MTELCSICEHDVANETAYMCQECWENNSIELLCAVCALRHSNTISLIGRRHLIEKIK